MCRLKEELPEGPTSVDENENLKTFMVQVHGLGDSYNVEYNGLDSSFKFQLHV